MQNIKVSIIIPVYNVADYLRRCLDSCVNQTLQGIEIIVVNDCSPDMRDSEIMKEYEEKFPNKVKCIWHKESKKQGGARNTGIRAASGGFVYFVDSDDYIDLTATEKMYNAIVQENADMAVCDCNYVNDGNIIKNWRPNGKFDSSNLCERIKSIKGSYIWFIMLRKSIIEDNELFFPEKNNLEDAISSLWYLAASKIVRINEALYYYVTRLNSVTQEKKYNDCISAIESVGDVLKTDYFKSLNDSVKKMLFLYYVKDIRFYCNYVCENYPAEFAKFYNGVLDLFKTYNAEDNTYKDIYSEEILNFIENNITQTDFNSKITAFYKKQYEKVWLDKIRKLISLYENKNLTIWGAGFFGKQNAKYMNKLRVKFEITDINSKIYGEKVASDVVVKPWEELKEHTDVVVSAGWAFEDVKERLSKECPNIEVVNLELFL